MSVKYFWIKFSIYTDQTNWARVLGDLIHSIVTENKIIIANYYTELSYFQGENIKLALNIKQENAAIVTKHVTFLIQEWFKKMGLISQSEIYESFIFTNFKANSIQFGIFTVPFNLDHLEFTNLYNTLSNILIKLLPKSTISDDIILETIYILESATFTAGEISGIIEKSDKHCFALLQQNLDRISASVKPEILQIFETIFECQKNNILNDSFALWKNEIDSLDYLLLEKWISVCVDFINTQKKNYRDPELFFHLQKMITNIIYKQFGLNGEMALLSSYVFGKCRVILY